MRLLSGMVICILVRGKSAAINNSTMSHYNTCKVTCFRWDLSTLPLFEKILHLNERAFSKIKKRFISIRTHTKMIGKV